MDEFVRESLFITRMKTLDHSFHIFYYIMLCYVVYLLGESSMNWFLFFYDLKKYIYYKWKLFFLEISFRRIKRQQFFIALFFWLLKYLLKYFYEYRELLNRPAFLLNFPTPYSTSLQGSL